MRRETVHQDMRGDRAVREERDRDRATVPPVAGTGEPAGPAVRGSGPVARGSGPVFVDATGRRSRTWRRAGVITALVCSCYATTVVATLIGGDSSAPFLELPRAMGMTREEASPPAPAPESVGGVSDAAPQDGVTRRIPYGEWPKATGWTPEPDATTAGSPARPSAEGRRPARPAANAPTAAGEESPAAAPTPSEAAVPSVPPASATPPGAGQSAPPRTGGAAPGSATAPAGDGGPEEEAPSGGGAPAAGPARSAGSSAGCSGRCWGPDGGIRRTGTPGACGRGQPADGSAAGDSAYDGPGYGVSPGSSRAASSSRPARASPWISRASGVTSRTDTVHSSA
ncbi:hypothetical protein EDD93_3349 [Streptomyces sp. 840.1]|nr:hypothetical protein EDD93_3349 [Streptomyces sp. 840.1]